MKAKVLKPLLLSAAAILLVVSTVLATMAYLTSSSAVSNVFTVGNVKLNMTETKVDSDGIPVKDAPRTDTNSYHLKPGKSYLKDPIIEVGATSDESYLFVRVRNDLKTLECPGFTINANKETFVCPHEHDCNTDECPGFTTNAQGETIACSHDRECKTILEQMTENGWYEIERASNNVDAVFVYIGTGTDVKYVEGTDTPMAKLVGGSSQLEEYDVFNRFTMAVHANSLGLDSFGGARVAIVAYAIQADIAGAGTQCSPEAYMNAWRYIKSELPFVV